MTNTNHNNTMKSTRAPSSSWGVQRGLGEMPDVATQAHRGPRSQGSDHGSKSQRAGTEKRAGERHLPSRSDSTRKGRHHIVKRPYQAGIRVPPRGPSHLHSTRGNNLNPSTTRSYVEVVQGVVPRIGRPTTATGPPHNTRYVLLPRAAPVISRSSTHSTHCAAQHPPRGGAARSYPTTDNTRHNPHPCAPCVAKGTQHARQRHKGESCCARQRKDWTRELGDERLLCAPVGETTPQVDIPGPTSRRWGEVPHRRLGMAAWTHLANGEGICLPLRGLDAEK